MASLLANVEVNAEAMTRAAAADYTNATDLADYLAKQGIPFREAHHITGKAVQYAEAKGKALDALTLEEFRSFSTVMNKDVFDYIRIEASVGHRDNLGGTAGPRVAEQIKKAQKELS